MRIVKSIYEHLKTKKKYNTLLLKYDVKCEEYDNKVKELNTLTRIKHIEREKYEATIEEYIKEINDLKIEISQLKKRRKNKES